MQAGLSVIPLLAHDQPAGVVHEVLLAFSQSINQREKFGINHGVTDSRSAIGLDFLAPMHDLD